MYKSIQSLAVASLLVSSAALADILPIIDDFESYNPADTETLFGSGWIVFGNVRTPSGTYLYGYGPDPAPNDGGGFSGVATGEGGPEQGANQLNTFSDYNNNAEHTAGNLVESNVYREQEIGAANVGETWTFLFNAKKGNLAPPTTAKAFIKTLDPENDFATTNEVIVFTTNNDGTWQGYELSLAIDAGLVGQLIQIGFANTATNFNDSGVFYDNVSFTGEAAPVDSDGDGVADDTDNCTDVANASQRDTDGDLIGNDCDADITNDCFVNFPDSLAYRMNFFQPGDVDTDNNGDGFTNFTDLQLLRDQFLGQPGPSAAGCN